MRHAAQVRRELGMKTIMNLVGPLSNPAEAEAQLIGVFAEGLCRPVAEAAKLLGVKRALVVHGLDGQDEVSVTGPTRVVELRGGRIVESPVRPGAGRPGPVPPGRPAGRLGGGERGAGAGLRVRGRGGAAVREAVLLNAGAALHVSGLAEGIEDGYRLARRALEEGRVAEKLAQIVAADRAEEEAAAAPAAERPMSDLLRRIVEDRRERRRRERRRPGAGPAAAPGRRPGRRSAGTPFLICEVKRRSPSRGEIAPGLDAAAQAGLYRRAGAGAVSVLTEEDHFGGSLADLVEVKRRHPGLAVLRKDFLLDEEDLEVSERAGADAVLLIAAALEAGTLARLAAGRGSWGWPSCWRCTTGRTWGRRGRSARPSPGSTAATWPPSGWIRSCPCALNARIDWPTRLVYESGVRGPEDGRLALAAGFDGLLVGEAVVRDPRADRRAARLLRRADAPDRRPARLLGAARRRAAGSRRGRW